MPLAWQVYWLLGLHFSCRLERGLGRGGDLDKIIFAALRTLHCTFLPRLMSRGTDRKIKTSLMTFLAMPSCALSIISLYYIKDTDEGTSY
jgi:hypothetical protein